jgi:hypothetical protein
MQTVTQHSVAPVVCPSGDTATATVIPTSGLNTTEAGGTAVFTIALDSQPSASVTVGVSSTDVGEGVVSSSFVIFATGVWNVAQTVTVTGVDDVWVDGDILYNITTAAFSSSDTNFNGELVPDVLGVVNMDGTAIPNCCDRHRVGICLLGSVFAHSMGCIVYVLCCRRYGDGYGQCRQ